MLSKEDLKLVARTLGGNVAHYFKKWSHVNVSANDLSALLSAARDEGRAEGLGGEWVMVPREPTREMLEIGTRCILGSSTIVCDDCVDLAQDMYRAMLSASQTQEG